MTNPLVSGISIEAFKGLVRRQAMTMLYGTDHTNSTLKIFFFYGTYYIFEDFGWRTPLHLRVRAELRAGKEPEDCPPDTSLNVAVRGKLLMK